MQNSKSEFQTVGCRVTSCRFNGGGKKCELSHIEVEPMNGMHTGEPCDESLCGSYRAK